MPKPKWETDFDKVYIGSSRVIIKSFIRTQIIEVATQAGYLSLTQTGSDLTVKLLLKYLGESKN